MKKILLIALLALSANTFAQTEDKGYRVISTIATANDVYTQYWFITNPNVMKSNVNAFELGMSIDGTEYKQGDMVLIQVVDSKLIHHQLVMGKRTDKPIVDARFDWIMQKGIKRLPGFNYVDNKNKATL